MLCDITENKTPSKIFGTFLEANLFFDFFFSASSMVHAILVRNALKSFVILGVIRQ